MVGFLIKKGFFDIWDNLLMIVLLNLGFLAPLLLFVLASYIPEGMTILTIAIQILAVLVYSLYGLGISAITFGYSRYRKGGFKAFKDAFKFHLGHAFLHFLVCIAIVLIILVAIPFYFSFANMFGAFMGMLMVWMVLLLVMAMQFFYPLCFHMEADGALKTFKKCFIVLADNLGTAFFLLLRSILDMVLTILTATLIPGLTGISLSRMDTMRLLMLKYDFLEDNPGMTKRDINWEDLLYDEKQLVGPRSLKGMIFPWKN